MIPSNCIEILQKVFDKDSFSAYDEIMDVEIDLQPLFASVGMREFLKRTQTVTPIDKLVPSRENYLAIESCIQYIDDNMIQDMCLRLHNVESGELEMHLKWVDVPEGLDGRV